MALLVDWRQIGVFRLQMRMLQSVWTAFRTTPGTGTLERVGLIDHLWDVQSALDHMTDRLGSASGRRSERAGGASGLARLGHLSQTPAWPPVLTNRQRVLLHAQPLILMQHAPGSRDEHEKHYDSLSLAIKTFDIIIDQSGFGSEVVRDTIAEGLAAAL